MSDLSYFAKEVGVRPAHQDPEGCNALEQSASSRTRFGATWLRVAHT